MILKQFQLQNILTMSQFIRPRVESGVKNNILSKYIENQVKFGTFQRWNCVKSIVLLIPQHLSICQEFAAQLRFLTSFNLVKSMILVNFKLLVCLGLNLSKKVTHAIISQSYSQGWTVHGIGEFQWYRVIMVPSPIFNRVGMHTMNPYTSIGKMQVPGNLTCSCIMNI